MIFTGSIIDIVNMTIENTPQMLIFGVAIFGIATFGGASWFLINFLFFNDNVR